jgi:hypothetical protein
VKFVLKSYKMTETQPIADASRPTKKIRSQTVYGDVFAVYGPKGAVYLRIMMEYSSEIPDKLRESSKGGRTDVFLLL